MTPLHGGRIEQMTTANIEHLEKLLKLEANDWPKFQEHLIKLHSDEFYQAPAQQECWEWGEIQCCSSNKNARRIYHSNAHYS